MYLLSLQSSMLDYSHCGSGGIESKSVAPISSRLCIMN